MTKVQKERFKRFLRDLRSGKFRQTRSALRRKNAYCCLGVACERYRRDTGKGEWTLDLEHTYWFLRRSGVLPEAVTRHFGMKADSGDPRLVISDDEHAEAALLNDEKRWNFKRIADAFERTYLGTVKGKKVLA